MSKREQVLAKIKDRMDASATVKASVSLRRVADLPDASYPAVVIAPGNTPVRVAAGGVSEHTMTVVIAALALGKNAEAEADTLAQAVLDEVKTDDTWGGLATDTTLTAVSEDKEQADKLRFGVALTLTVRFETGLWEI